VALAAPLTLWVCYYRHLCLLCPTVHWAVHSLLAVWAISKSHRCLPSQPSRDCVREAWKHLWAVCRTHRRRASLRVWGRRSPHSGRRSGDHHQGDPQRIRGCALDSLWVPLVMVPSSFFFTKYLIIVPCFMAVTDVETTLGCVSGPSATNGLGCTKRFSSLFNVQFTVARQGRSFFSVQSSDAR